MTWQLRTSWCAGPGTAGLSWALPRRWMGSRVRQILLLLLVASWRKWCS
jgi:hypothetical protein